MKQGQQLWTREELILAIHLYCQLPFGRLHSRNPDIIQLAALIGRSANAVAYKLNNFASLDPSLHQRGIKGAVNSSKLDRIVWDDFFSNLEQSIQEQEHIIKTLYPSEEENNWVLKEGTDSIRTVKVRDNQGFFRQMILSSYNFKCCITGINNPDLLIAGHIIPWKSDYNNRLNPSNGICINALHDKAFETGLITISPDYKVLVSKKIKKDATIPPDFFEKYDNQPIILPGRFLPDPQLLKIHNQKFQY